MDNVKYIAEEDIAVDIVEDIAVDIVEDIVVDIVEEDNYFEYLHLMDFLNILTC